jgi:hypothetical protein
MIDSWYPAHHMRAVRDHLSGVTFSFHEPRLATLLSAQILLAGSGSAFRHVEHAVLASRSIGAGGHYLEQAELWSEQRQYS